MISLLSAYAAQCSSTYIVYHVTRLKMAEGTQQSRQKSGLSRIIPKVNKNTVDYRYICTFALMTN